MRAPAAKNKKKGSKASQAPGGRRKNKHRKAGWDLYKASQDDFWDDPIIQYYVGLDACNATGDALIQPRHIRGSRKLPRLIYSKKQGRILVSELGAGGTAVQIRAEPPRAAITHASTIAIPRAG